MLREPLRFLRGDLDREREYDLRRGDLDLISDIVDSFTITFKSGIGCFSLDTTVMQKLCEAGRTLWNMEHFIYHTDKG